MTSVRPSKRNPSAGVTLIEMMVSLAMFALIGAAGFAMLDQVLRSQRGTEGRLEQLSELQRALHVIQTDFAMADPHSLQAAGNAVSIDRSHPDGNLRLRYWLSDGTLHRDLTQVNGAALADQVLLTGIETVAWRFLTPNGIWSDVWPADPVQTLTVPANPRAIELTIALPDGGGMLRRVAPLPTDLE